MNKTEYRRKKYLRSEKRRKQKLQHIYFVCRKYFGMWSMYWWDRWRLMSFPNTHILFRETTLSCGSRQVLGLGRRLLSHFSKKLELITETEILQ